MRIVCWVSNRLFSKNLHVILLTFDFFACNHFDIRHFCMQHFCANSSCAYLNFAQFFVDVYDKCIKFCYCTSWNFMWFSRDAFFKNFFSSSLTRFFENFQKTMIFSSNFVIFHFFLQNICFVLSLLISFYYCCCCCSYQYDSIIFSCIILFSTKISFLLINVIFDFLFDTWRNWFFVNRNWL